MKPDFSINRPIVKEIYGHDLYEYLFVAHPDSLVNEKIKAEKEFFSTEFLQKIASKTLPHITIANFLAKEAIEETFILWIQLICKQQQSF